MANILPIIAGLGAAYFLLQKHDASDSGNGSSSWGGTAGGDTPCHLLTGIWAPATGGAESPLNAVTANPNLVYLPLTPEAFQEIDGYLAQWIKDNDVEKDAAVSFAAKHISDGLDCAWGSPNSHTPRMNQVRGAINSIYDAHIESYLEAKYNV